MTPLSRPQNIHSRVWGEQLWVLRDTHSCNCLKLLKPCSLWKLCRRKTDLQVASETTIQLFHGKLTFSSSNWILLHPIARIRILERLKVEQIPLYVQSLTESTIAPRGPAHITRITWWKLSPVRSTEIHSLSVFKFCSDYSNKVLDSLRNPWEASLLSTLHNFQ